VHFITDERPLRLLTCPYVHTPEPVLTLNSFLSYRTIHFGAFGMGAGLSDQTILCAGGVPNSDTLAHDVPYPSCLCGTSHDQQIPHGLAQIG